MPISVTAKTVILIAALATLLAGISLTAGKPKLETAAIGAVPKPSALRVLRSADAPPPDVSAAAVRVERLKTGEVLFERESGRRLPIASLTKLMTALLLAESVEPLQEIPFSAQASGAGSPDEKRSAVLAGDTLKAEDVLKLLLVSSDADAAYATAEYVAVLKRPELGDARFEERIRAFVALMNQRAGELGLADTRFANPGGSDDPENYSSAQDLARLAAFITERRPELWAATRIRETFVFGASGRRYGAVNTNALLEGHPAIYGSKTGFEDEAKGTLLLVYQIAREEPVAIILLRSQDRESDGRTAIRWLESNFAIESP